MLEKCYSFEILIFIKIYLFYVFIVLYFDFDFRIFFVYIKEIESKFILICWGVKMFFVNCMFEVFNGGGKL